MRRGSKPPGGEFRRPAEKYKKCGNELAEVIENRGRALKIGVKTNSKRTQIQAQICANRTQKGAKTAHSEQNEVRALDLRGSDDQGTSSRLDERRPFAGATLVAALGVGPTPRCESPGPAAHGAESAVAALFLLLAILSPFASLRVKCAKGPRFRFETD